MNIGESTVGSRVQVTSTSNSLKVTPAVLIAKADVVKSKIQRLQESYEGMQSAVNRTDGYWVGEAGDLYRKRYKELGPLMEEIVKRLREHVKDLNQMAGVYTETEAEVKEMAESLPADVIL